jgi:anti-anti-sigma factor
MTEFEIDAYRKGHETLVVLRGRLVLTQCPDAKNRLNALFTHEVDRFYLLMRDLDFLDSAGLGVLVGLKMSANKHQTSLAILSPPPRIADIFRVSKLDTILDVREGAEAEIVRASIERDEYCLWRDGNRGSQAAFNTDLGQGAERANLTQIADFHPDQQVSHIVREACNEAVEFIRQGDYQRAIECYQRALRSDPQNLSALNNLGIVYEKRPEWYGRAKDVWKQVLDLSLGQNDDKHATRARKHLELLGKLIPEG